MARKEEFYALIVVFILFGVPIIGLVSILFPVSTTCPDPPKLEHGKYQLGVPSTFYAYGKHNDTVGIINPTGTNAVYSCKGAGFTLMCKESEGDEEGGWKRCKGKEFSLGCSANSTWLPQVELECRDCQGEACEGAEPSEFFISK